MTPEQLRAEIEGPIQHLPQHLRSGLADYLTHRQPTGRFLRAILENDLREAVLRADPVSQGAFRELVLFLDNHAPPQSHGCPEAVRQWLEGGR